MKFIYVYFFALIYSIYNQYPYIQAVLTLISSSYMYNQIVNYKEYEMSDYYFIPEEFPEFKKYQKVGNQFYIIRILNKDYGIELFLRMCGPLNICYMHLAQEFFFKQNINYIFVLCILISVINLTFLWKSMDYEIKIGEQIKQKFIENYENKKSMILLEKIERQIKFFQ